VKYAFIFRHETDFAVRRMCLCLHASPSGYYAWRGRHGKPGPRALKRQALDARVAAFRAMSAQFLEDLLNQFFISIDHQDKDIPGKFWIEQDAAQLKAVEDFLTDTRIEMTKEGLYDARMMKILKKVRCSLDTTREECGSTDE